MINITSKNIYSAHGDKEGVIIVINKKTGKMQISSNNSKIPCDFCNCFQKSCNNNCIIPCG